MSQCLFNVTVSLSIGSLALLPCLYCPVSMSNGSQEVLYPLVLAVRLYELDFWCCGGLAGLLRCGGFQALFLA